MCRWNLFNLTADLLTAGVLIGIVAMLLRRWVIRPKDFAFADSTPVEPEARAGILRDSSLVASFIIFHVGCRLMFKATQVALRGSDGFQPMSSLVAALFGGVAPGALEILGHFFWWGALGSILLFIPYFPRSKHIHIFLAPINLALKKDQPGVLQPMDFEKEEVFGAAKLEDFTWPRLLDSYSCIMCNRCQDVCPANVTGKALSPAAILINERYELNKILAELFQRPGESRGRCSTSPSTKKRLGPARPATLASKSVRWATNRCSISSTCGASACLRRRSFPRGCKILSTIWSVPAIRGAWLPRSGFAWAKGLAFAGADVGGKPRP